MQCLQDKRKDSKESTFEVDQTGSIAAPVKLTAATNPWGQYGRQRGYSCEATADLLAGRMLVRDMFGRGSTFSRTGSQDCPDKDATWTKKPPNDFRGSLTIVGVNNGGKDGGKGTEGGIRKNTPVEAAAAEAAAALNSFESLDDRQAQWEHHKSLRRNGAQSLIEDGLGPGNGAELSDHLLSSAMPKQDRPTKTDQHDNEHESSHQLKLASAFVARLDAEDFVYQIK